MKKKEWIYLHGLLAEVHRNCRRYDDAVDPDLSEYESLGIRPSSIHRSKADHREAVLALAPALASELEPEVYLDEETPVGPVGDGRDLDYDREGKTLTR